MGGAVIRKEPATTALLEHYPAAYQIFEQAGWLNYFRRLQGYNEQQVLQFARNLQENHSVVAGIRISVTEEDISESQASPLMALDSSAESISSGMSSRVSSWLGKELY
jgi:hypothetical protein